LTESDRDAIISFFEGLQALAIKAQQELGGQIQFNPDNINWQDSEGQKGPFQKSEDLNNQNHKSLLSWLNKKGGKANMRGFFYWVYQNGSMIGRKKMSGKRRG